MKFIPTLFILLVVCGFLGCSVAPLKESNLQNSSVIFKIEFDHSFLRENQVEISITVPSSVGIFSAPKDYGGAPVFTQYLKNVQALDSHGLSLPTQIKDNIVTVTPSSTPSYTLKYTYLIPQKVSGEVDQSLPNLNNTYGRFDNNLLFLVPEGLEKSAAKLYILPPKNWRVVTGWGEGYEFNIASVSQLVSGMIALGDFEYSNMIIGNTAVTFAIKGDYSHDLIKDQFAKVLRSQQEIAGPLPSTQFLVVFQPTVNGCCKGTSLSHSLIVNIPSTEKLIPFNFPAVATISHELFHQWNFKHIYPASEDGVYLFSEGFTNYFAVAALVKAKLVPPESFAWFLWHYRNRLEKNPKYKGSDFQKIQSGFKNNDSDLVDLAYTRGPFVAVLLDIALREDTAGKESIVSWFRKLNERFGGIKGYTINDLRNLIIELSGKPQSKALKVFDESFLGSIPINTTALFKKLGISCDNKSKKCILKNITDLKLRNKLFSALP